MKFTWLELCMQDGRFEIFKMKKIISFFALLLLLSCGDETGIVTKEKNNFPKEDTVSVADTVQYDVFIKRPGWEQVADSALKYLAEKNYRALSKLVHPKRGLRFSAGPQYSGTALAFDSTKIRKLAKDKTKYVWANNNESAEPLRLTFDEYYKKFIFDKNYLKADSVNRSGNEAETDLFPRTIDFYCIGTEKNNFTDSSVLKLIFEMKDHNWYLVEIAHSQWKI
jgi:hypothetical protein